MLAEGTSLMLNHPPPRGWFPFKPSPTRAERSVSEAEVGRGPGEGVIPLCRELSSANGHLPDIDKARVLLHQDDFIICADGGTRHALALNLRPNLIIGDMDSAEKGQLQQ